MSWRKFTKSTGDKFLTFVAYVLVIAFLLAFNFWACQATGFLSFYQP